MSAVPAMSRQPPHAMPDGIVRRVVSVACVMSVAVAVSGAEDWQPATLVLALGGALIIAELATFPARHIRISAGLMVQTTMMALLGPGPAVVGNVLAVSIEGRANHVPLRLAANNAILVAILGLVGGLLFDGLRGMLDLDRHDSDYALLVLPVYVALSVLNLLIVATTQIQWPRRERLRVVTETGVPAAALELVNGMFAMAAVLVWARAGLVAAAVLIMVLVVAMRLAGTLSDALRTGDDLVALRQVSDERAAEVARLASDRDRLLSEAMDAESRERTRLAESLHDGPMQRFLAIRQDAAETDPGLAEHLGEAIAETRSLISAFHPATVRELGFAASLHAAVAPFPAARAVTLTVHSDVDDRAVADSMLQPVAQELVVNAVKHASPATIDVLVKSEAATLVLEVNDDGVGIDTAQAGRAVQAGHVGLAMVRRRVEDAGGQIEIATRPDGGTRSRIVLPAPTDG